MSISWLICAVAVAGSEQDLKDFSTANEKALAGDFDAAVALYQHLVERDVHHEDVYFNLGTALARAGRLVDAVVALETARSIEPGDKEVKKNLEAVKKKLRPADRSQQNDAVHTTDIIAGLVSHLPRRPLRWISIGAEFVLFGLLFARSKAREDTTRAKLLIGILFSALIFLTSGILTLGHEIVSADRRSVAKEVVIIRDGPDTKFNEKSKLYAGETVRRLATDGSFEQIRGEDGRTGWVEADKLKEIRKVTAGVE